MARLSARLRARKNDDRGAAAVEFALVVVPLVLLVFGICGFGMLFAQSITLNSAARDSARMAVVPTLSNSPISCSDVVTAARNSASTIGMKSSDVTVTVLRGTSTVCTSTSASSTKPCVGSTNSGTGSQLTVRLTYKSTVNLGLSAPSFDLKGEGTFRCEYSV